MQTWDVVLRGGYVNPHGFQSVAGGLAHLVRMQIAARHLSMAQEEFYSDDLASLSLGHIKDLEVSQVAYRDKMKVKIPIAAHGSDVMTLTKPRPYMQDLLDPRLTMPDGRLTKVSTI